VAGGEPLERVQVSVVEAGRNAVTAADGTFVIPNLPPGNYTLRLSAVGYRLSSISFSLSGPDDSKEFSLVMVPDNFRHTETVRVTGDIFQPEDSPAVVESNLTPAEIRETSNVFADDLFRAIQALPGVSALENNEVYAQLSIMGTPFENVSIYLDDVLATPFHSIPDISNGASLSLLTSETVEEMKLMPVARFRGSAGIADSDILGEGPLGAAKRGSWIASARKSYIGWLIRGRENDVLDVTFYDGDAKLVYDLTPKQTVSFQRSRGSNLYGTGSKQQPGRFRDRR
jgi:CarboxypepD_reg-like domain